MAGRTISRIVLALVTFNLCRCKPVLPVAEIDGDGARSELNARKHFSGNSSGNCSCAGEDLLDKDCCPCTVTQVAEATSTYFKDQLQQLVQTPLFRVYTPYPEHKGKPLYDVQCSIPEFRDLAKEISALQIGCAIQQCGCSESDCAGEHWRHQPCFTQCEKDTKAQEAHASDLVSTIPVTDDGTGRVQYDLLDNPEQFTGYGTLLDDKSARMIWDNLYSERFCFATCPAEAEAELSVEKRLVYRVVSGLHASINTHLASLYGFYTDTQEPATRENWGFARELRFGPWRKLFDERVGRHPDRIRNMHFVFALLTRALQRLKPRLNEVLEAGSLSCSKCAGQHNHTRDLIQRLVSPPPNAPEACSVVLSAFDYASLFSEQTADSARLKDEVKTRFKRMGDMMTCVGCDRCKLWGTLQFHAARVAFDILVSSNEIGDAGASGMHELRPNDIVALVNALAQVSKSIDHVRHWTAKSHSEARDEL